MPESSAARRVNLDRLRADVALARAGEARQAGGSHYAIDAARAETLQALSDYATALEELSWPVPRVVQMEIRLLRCLGSAGSEAAP